MRLTRDDGSRKVAIYRVYETIKDSEEKYQEKRNECEIYNKLADLEDIEEELGIDLITLFKALKNGEFYSKHPETGEVSWIPLPELYYCSRKWNIGCVSMIFNEQENHCDSWDCDPKDYGKTWALDKKELGE